MRTSSPSRAAIFLACVALILLGAAAPRLALACSECLCGTPFPSDVLGGVVPSQFSYGLEERYLSKSNALDEGPGDEREHEHRIAAFGLWRPRNRLAILGRVPHDWKTISSHPLGASADEQSSSGFGDAELLALAGLVTGGGACPTVGLVLGGTAPTGSNVVRDGSGARLDAHLQPGSGAWSGTAGVHLSQASSIGTWDASVLGRANGTSPHGYRYGNVLLVNAGYTSRTWRSLRLLAQLNGRSAARDRLEDGTSGANTGGTVVYAAPGVRWDSGLGLAIEGGVQVPFAQRLYGVQTEHTTGRLTLTISR
jgi:hypothetical protein